MIDLELTRPRFLSLIFENFLLQNVDYRLSGKALHLKCTLYDALITIPNYSSIITTSKLTTIPTTLLTLTIIINITLVATPLSILN